MAKTYRVSPAVRISNTIVTALLRGGIMLGQMALLTVPGRKSGQPRTVPVALLERNGERWLSSPYGEVNWVRNLRAAGQATLTRGRRAEAISAVELSPTEAAPVLKWAISHAPSFVRGYFDVAPDASLEAFIQEAPRHPVFRIEAATSPTYPSGI
jgi:deazaflavin-dependent oxidoreductase (nitroreductase family)